MSVSASKGALRQGHCGMSRPEDDSADRWREQDTRDFLDYGRYFVPDREEQIETIVSLIPPMFGAGHIFDLGCGEGVLAKALLDRFPDCRVHGLDASAGMLARAREALAGFRGRFEPQLFDLADVTWRKPGWPVHAVVSSLAIHHLDASQKQALFGDVRRMLAPGGAFVIADVVEPAGPLGRQLAAAAWDGAVRARALRLDGHLAAYEHFRRERWNLFADPEPDPMDTPSLLLDQLRWLERAGLDEVDVFWMKAGHAIFGGRAGRA